MFMSARVPSEVFAGAASQKKEPAVATADEDAAAAVPAAPHPGRDGSPLGASRVTSVLQKLVSGRCARHGHESTQAGFPCGCLR